MRLTRENKKRRPVDFLCEVRRFLKRMRVRAGVILAPRVSHRRYSAPIGSDLMKLSVIVPFLRDVASLQRCLSALNIAGRLLHDGAILGEIIVVADGVLDDPTSVVAEHGVTLLAIPGPSGPAVARSRGAAMASGDVLV